MAACGIDLAATPQLHQVDVWTSHEGLLLDYEEGADAARLADRRLVRLLGAHALDRRAHARSRDGAHVEFFAGVHNPLGVQARADGDAATRCVELCERLNPDRIPGRLTLDRAAWAPTRVARAAAAAPARRARGRASRRLGLRPDARERLHVAGGRKTRHFDAIMAEIEGFFAACRAEGVWPGGVHLEFTGEDVTECLGGSEDVSEEQLDHRYETLCDPRLNARQSLDLAFRARRADAAR